MNYGSDAADQVVRYSLEGMDYGLRLSGTMAKNLAVFFAAVLKDQKKTYGKTRMVRMLKENRPLKFFTVPSNRIREFAKEGKKRGLLYVIIRDRKNPSQCEVMVLADDAAKVNRVMDKMNLDFLKSESGEAVQEVAEGLGKTMEGTDAPSGTVEGPDSPPGTVEGPGTTEETVKMPEGDIRFELGGLDQDFGFGEPEEDTENFTGAREERNPSVPSSRSSGIFSGPETLKPEAAPGQAGQPESADKDGKTSVRAELEGIKREKQEAARKKAQGKNRGRQAGRKKKKAKGR